MGRGNWIPSTPIYQGDYELVYVELQDVCDRPDEDEQAKLYEDFYNQLEEILPKSFSRVERSDSGKYPSRDTVVMFRNGLLSIVMDCEGDYWHQGLAVVGNENAPPFAQAKIGQIADRLWKGLYEAGYNLSVRDCAWTCSPFIPRGCKERVKV